MVVSEVVPSLSNLLRLLAEAAAAGAAASGAASTAVVVASVEADVVLAAVGEEEDTETEEDLETEVDLGTVAVVSEAAAAAASGEAGMTLDHREVEVATGSSSLMMNDVGLCSLTLFVSL